MKLSKAELDAVIQASPRTFVPFHRLVLSTDYQARTAGSVPKLSISELAASIKLCGVLQNLVVVQGPRNLYEVCAGGRRLEALGLLVAAGDLAENFPVPVLVVPADRALIASLAENTFHVPMHPADEFEAFAKLIAQGRSVEDTAALFGVTPLVVKRRLRLAAVSPKLMVQFREGTIGLDCLMVLAGVEDHERQEQAWAALETWNRHPEFLRRILAQGEVESDRCPVAKYVTVKAYEKAGGPTRRDLFSDDDRKVYLLDAVLLDQLAVQKLQRRAKQVAAEGWKWVDVRARHVHDEYARHGTLRKVTRSPDEEEAAAIAGVRAQMVERSRRMDALSAAGDAGNDGSDDEEEYSRLETECEGLQVQLDAQYEALATWPADLMAQAGCVVFVGNDAAPAVRYGLIRPEDREEFADLVRTADADASGAAEAEAAVASMPAARTRPVHSEKLVRNLTAHRVAGLQAELLARPEVALAVLTAQLASKLLIDSYRRHSDDEPLTLSATDAHASLRNDAEDIEASPAWQAVEAQRQSWSALAPDQADAMLPWMLQQDGATVMRLFTFLVASTVTGVHAVGPKTQRTDGLATALGLDMRRWWTATATSYFSHVSKARITEVVIDAAGLQAAATVQSLKKDAAATAAEQAVAGTGWLPAVLQTPKPPLANGGATGDAQEDAVGASCEAPESLLQTLPGPRSPRCRARRPVPVSAAALPADTEDMA